VTPHDACVGLEEATQGGGGGGGREREREREFIRTIIHRRMRIKNDCQRLLVTLLLNY
jgi:hypothetical protein